MPISADRFEDIPDDGDVPSPETNAGAILAFLRDNPEKAFTRGEIASETDIKEGSVGPTLVRLRERGRVDHRGSYWRVSDHEASVNTATMHTTAAIAAHEDDGETPSYNEWQEHAIDPREIDE